MSQGGDGICIAIYIYIYQVMYIYIYRAITSEVLVKLDIDDVISTTADFTAQVDVVWQPQRPALSVHVRGCM